MGEKHSDVFKQQRETQRRAYVSTPSLREEFPQVEQLVVQMSFTDPRGIGHHSPQTHSFSPAAKAFFWVACPFSMCIDGGFALGPIISKMLARGAGEASGKLECQGWHSLNRADEHRCRLEMQYRLTVSYNHPESRDEPSRAQLR